MQRFTSFNETYFRFFKIGLATVPSNLIISTLF